MYNQGVIEKKPNPAVFIGLAILLFAFITVFLLRRTSTPADIPAPTPSPVPMVKPTGFIPVSPTETDTASWKTYRNKSLSVSLKYPSSVIIDTRQTTEGRRVAFIAAGDKRAPLPDVPTVFLTGFPGAGEDGFDVFSRTDCSQPCTILPQNVTWVQINNAFGIKNPLPGDRENYYLTDERKSGPILNVYIGGLNGQTDEKTEKKIELFEMIISTISFSR